MKISCYVYSSSSRSIVSVMLFVISPHQHNVGHLSLLMRVKVLTQVLNINFNFFSLIFDVVCMFMVCTPV